MLTCALIAVSTGTNTANTSWHTSVSFNYSDVNSSTREERLKFPITITRDT